MKFEALKLIDPLLKAVHAEGYENPTPIQEQAIPLVLARKDVLACAQTGTGKTAAFALPILQILSETKTASNVKRAQDIRVLVLTPTRELASQIAESFTNYGQELSHKNAVIFGGVGQHSQVRALRAGVDILIATPGRLLDLMQQRHVHFRGLEIFVLDEADRMLDMGFINDVRKIISAIPKQRQTLFFSATMPPEISRLSQQILTKPTRIEVTPVATTAEKITQFVYHVQKKQKTSLLIHLMNEHNVERALVFTRTKRDANRVSELLNQAKIRAEAIHGNKSQNAREAALASIKKGQCRVLVATDIAARGIDIDQVTHVFNHDIPNVPESYVHRIGRTARAGTSGTAISLCSSEERGFLSDIERLIRMKVNVKETPDGIEVEKPLRSHRASPIPTGAERPRPHSGRPAQGRPPQAHSSQSGRNPIRVNLPQLNNPGFSVRPHVEESEAPIFFNDHDEALNEQDEPMSEMSDHSNYSSAFHRIQVRAPEVRSERSIRSQQLPRPKSVHPMRAHKQKDRVSSDSGQMSAESQKPKGFVNPPANPNNRRKRRKRVFDKNKKA